MSWKTTNKTGTELDNWIAANKVKVETSVQAASTLLFAKTNQTTIRQREKVTTYELRGLDAATGKRIGSQFSDNTTQTTYYAKFDGEVHSINVTSGSKDEYGAARRDESGQWCVTVKRTEFSTSPSALPVAWGTTKIDASGETITLGSGTPVVVSMDKSTTHIATWAKAALYSTIATTVTEHRYIATQAQAQAIVDANQSAAQTHRFTTTVTAELNGQKFVASWAWRDIPYGTEKFASARFVSEAEGWCVTVTEKVYGKTGNAWVDDGAI